jgi:peptidoglycan/LPS O-acetylase OafA/YrhL
MNTKSVERRHDVDWLRVLAFSAVFLYHCSRFFDSDWWHIKNATSSLLVDMLKQIFDLWGMPLIFVISGASIFFALRPGGAIRFLRDRVLRLLVPLAFGILVLGPPQVYLTRLTHGDFQGSLLDFLPLYFRDWNVWGGNFAWKGVHLWYLEDLFLFTLVLLPLFAALKSSRGQRYAVSLGRLASRPGVIFLWTLPLALVLIGFDPLGVLGPGLSENMSRIVVFPIFLVFGFLVFSDGQTQQAIIRQRRIALLLAVSSTLAAGTVADALGQAPSLGVFVLGMGLASLLTWTSILAVLGYGMRYLTTGSPRLSYANEAVLPFYVLHQPVILIIGYFVVPLALPILAKYLIITPLAFGITLGAYEFGVRRWDPVRRVFGLKPRKSAPRATALVAEPAS